MFDLGKRLLELQSRSKKKLERLYVFYDPGNEDWIVASSAQEAFDYQKSIYGIREDEMSPLHEWQKCNDTDLLTIKDDNGNSERQTMEQWIKRSKKGLLASRNF